MKQPDVCFVLVEIDFAFRADFALQRSKPREGLEARGPSEYLSVDVFKLWGETLGSVSTVSQSEKS